MEHLGPFSLQLAMNVSNNCRALARDGRVGGVAINFADRRAWFSVWLFLDSFSFLTATPSSSAHRGTLKPFHVVKRNVCSLIFSYFRSLWIL